jgi:FkbM family methyltransferase
MSMIDGARTHYRIFGLRGIVLIARARLSRRAMQITVASGRHLQPVHLRMRTTDVSVYEEIIVNSEYLLDVDREPTVVVDAGANIGLTSVFFANRFPNARIISVEPEAANFAMLRKNAEPYRNITPVEAALWRSDTLLDLSDPGTGNWGFQTEEPQEPAETSGRVRGLTIDTLMREAGVDHIDILKVDIEGAEKEVFEACETWIDKVGVLVVEFHDRWKSGCSETVRNAAKDFPITWTKGETTFFYRTPTESRNSRADGHTAQARPSTRARVVAVQH